MVLPVISLMELTNLLNPKVSELARPLDVTGQVRQFFKGGNSISKFELKYFNPKLY